MKEHSELYKQPHLRSFYSNAFKGVMGEARNFCGDISALKLQQARLHSDKINPQMMANEQQQTETCIQSNIGIYLDQVGGVASRYALCKQECFDNNPKLLEQITDREERKANSQDYFDPLNTDACMRDCRAKFYHITKKVNNYFIEDKGFYVESAAENLNKI